MKILFLTPWYPDEKRKNHGVFIREQAKTIAERHEVAVISSKVDYQRFGLSSFTLSESKFEQLSEYRLVIKRSLPIFNQLNYFFVSRKVALKVAKSFKPDVIHGNIGYPGAFWSWLVSKRLQKPFLITEHTFITNNFRSFFHKLITLFSLKRADAIVTVGKKSAEEILKYVHANIQVVPNIVDTSRFTIQPYSEGIVNIGFLGRLSSKQHVKGLDVLLKALSNVRKDFVLYIGGEGELLDEYKSMAAELGIGKKCDFLGKVDFDEVPAFMNRLHFFVNSSRFESFGIAIVEAMASGLPVVTFDNGGPADFVNSSNGILVQNQNEEKLTQALDEMISSYLSYKRERIREGVMLKFSKERFIGAMEEIYSSAVKQFLIQQLP